MRKSNRKRKKKRGGGGGVGGGGVTATGKGSKVYIIFGRSSPAGCNPGGARYVKTKRKRKLVKELKPYVD